MDGAIRKLTTAGKLKPGAIEVAVGDCVEWRAARKQWEKLDVTTVEDLATPVDRALYLEMAGAKVAAHTYGLARKRLGRTFPRLP